MKIWRKTNITVFNYKLQVHFVTARVWFNYFLLWLSLTESLLFFWLCSDVFRIYGNSLTAKYISLTVKKLTCTSVELSGCTKCLFLITLLQYLNTVFCKSMWGSPFDWKHVFFCITSRCNSFRWFRRVFVIQIKKKYLQFFFTKKFRKIKIKNIDYVTYCAKYS